MNKTMTLALLASLVAAPALAATKTYQVTGPVVEVKEDMIVVQKGKEKWEIARGADAKLPADIKPGQRVTVEYRMTASSIEVKGGKGAATAAGSAANDNAAAAGAKAERAGDKAERAGDKAEAKAENAAEKAGNKAEKAGNKAEKAGDKAEAKADKAAK